MSNWGRLSSLKSPLLLNTLAVVNLMWDEKKINKYFCLFYDELFFRQCFSSFASRLERRGEKCEWIKLNSTWQKKACVLSNYSWFIIQSGSPSCNGNVFLRSMRDQVSHAKSKARKNYWTTDTMRWTKNSQFWCSAITRIFFYFCLTEQFYLKNKPQQNFHSLISQNHKLKALKNERRISSDLIQLMPSSS